jgi:hypothetical protein
MCPQKKLGKSQAKFFHWHLGYKIDLKYSMFPFPWEFQIIVVSNTYDAIYRWEKLSKNIVKMLPTRKGISGRGKKLFGNKWGRRKGI